MIKKLKNFMHRHENLEKMILFVWGIFWIIRAKFIFKKIKHNIVKEGKPRVLILAIRTIPTTALVYFDAIFGHAFRKLGCDVKMLYCDGVLDSCDADTVSRNQRPQCFVCKKFNKHVKDSLNLDCLSCRQYISKSDVEEIKEKVADFDITELQDYKYLGVNVSEHARASAIRFFISGQLDLDDPNQEAVLRKKLVYAIITTKIAHEVYLKEKPKVVFMLHGIYATWGPFFDYFRIKNIDVIIYGGANFHLGHFSFIRNARAHEIIARKTWDNFKQIPLSVDEETQIDAYLVRRFKGAAGDQLAFKENFDVESKKKSLIKAFFNKKYSRRYVMYPNLAWDACVEGGGSVIFKDIFSWIDTVIDYFKRKTDYQLIVKPHPAELVWEKCSRGIRDYIYEKHGSLPENIVILKADTSLTAHDLIAPETICLSFSGTVGLESATQGIPVLVAGNIHYKDAGVVYKIKTLKEYLSLLDNPEKLISFAKANTKIAKKYAYFYFFKALIRIPLYSGDKWEWWAIHWDVIRRTEELFDKKGPIIKICKKIIKGEDIVNPL